MGHTRGLSIALTLCALFCLPVFALSADQEMRAALAHIEQEIVVSAERGDPVKGFVDQALADGPDKHIARWHRPVCLTVRGFTGDQEPVFQDRFATVAALAGLRMAGAPCKPSVIALLTDDPDRLIDRMLKDHPRIFTPQKPAQVRRALADGGAVRVWHHAIIANADGTSTGGAAAGAAGVTQVVNIRTGGASRLGSNTRAELFRAVIVLDVRLLPGYGLEQVASHVAMLALGRFQPGLHTGQETILNLFQDAPTDRQADLSALDRQMLTQLYAATANNRSEWQRREIARKISTGTAE